MSIELTRRRFMLLASSAIAVSAMAAGEAEANATDEAYPIGDGKVIFRTFNYGPGRMCFAPHYSEQTCVRAAESVLKQRGGTIIQLVHPGGRNISFRLKGKQYVFDPNRIFTEPGIRNTLSNLGRNYSDEAHALVRAFAEEILHRVAGHGALIALHNNTGGTYSFKSYQAGGEYVSSVTALHANLAMNPSDFFFTTNPSLYSAIAIANFNVALQVGRRIPDDGSLSVYYGQRGMDYVNIESLVPHLAVQTQMIEAIAY